MRIFTVFFPIYKQKCRGVKQLLWFTVFSLIEHKDVAGSQKNSNLANCAPTHRQIKYLLCCFKEFTSRQQHRANINQWHVSKMRLMFTLTAFHLTSNKLFFLHQNAWLNFIFHFAVSVLKLLASSNFKARIHWRFIFYSLFMICINHETLPRKHEYARMRAVLGWPHAQWQVRAVRCKIVLIMCLEMLRWKPEAAFGGLSISHPPNKYIFK